MKRAFLILAMGVILMVSGVSSEQIKRDRNHVVGMFRGNSGRTAAYKSQGVHKQPKVRWQFKFSSSSIRPRLVVAKATVFFVIPERTGHLQRVRIKTGKHTELKLPAAHMLESCNNNVSRLVIVDGIMYYPYWREGRTPRNRKYGLCAVSLRTGRPKWLFKTKMPVESAPAVCNGIIYFGDDEGYLYAVDVNTGKQRWRFKVQTAIQSCSIAVDPKHVYFKPSDDLHILAVDIKTGKKVWRTQIQYPDRYPVVADGMVYTTSPNVLRAIDGATGKTKWQFSRPGRIMPLPAVANKTVYVGNHQTMKSHLYALDSMTGEVKWNYETKKGGPYDPIVADGTVYFWTGPYRFLHAVDAQNGKLKWEFERKGGLAVPSIPVIGDGVICYGCGGKLYGLR